MAENTMTIGQVINEAASFRYSQDYYNLYKECSEADLMATWLEAQEFKEDNMYLLQINEGYEYREDYLIESADNYNIQLITEKWQEKVKNVGADLKKRFLNIIQALIKFFEKLLNINYTKTEDQRKELADKPYENLKILDANADKVKEILKKYYNAVQKKGLWNPGTGPGSFQRKCMNIVGPISDDSSIRYENLLSVAISAKSVIINIPADVKVVAIGTSKNSNILKVSENSDKTPNIHLAKPGKNFGLAMGFEDLKKNVEFLKKLQESYKNAPNDDKNTGSNKEVVSKPKSGATAELNNAADILEGFSNLLLIYNEVKTYRANTISALYKLVKNVTKNGNGNNKEASVENNTKDNNTDTNN